VRSSNQSTWRSFIQESKCLLTVRICWCRIVFEVAKTNVCI